METNDLPKRSSPTVLLLSKRERTKTKEPKKNIEDSCLQKHEVELTRSEHFLAHNTVGVFFHALLLGKSEELPRHQTEQVELLHV